MLSARLPCGHLPGVSRVPCIRCVLTSTLVFPKTKGSFEKPRLEMFGTLPQLTFEALTYIIDFITALIVLFKCLGVFCACYVEIKCLIKKISKWLSFAWSSNKTALLPKPLHFTEAQFHLSHLPAFIPLGA